MTRILNRNWRTEGLNDDYLVLVSDLGKSEEDKARIKEFRVQCYSNITMCLIKLGNEMLPEACRTCDFILQLDSTNVKALFRKAKCLVEPMSCGDAEADEAIEHLRKALEIDPHNRDSEMDKLRNDVESRLKDAHLLRDIHRSRGEEDEATNMDVYINEPLQLPETGQPDDALCKDVMDRFGLDLKDPIVNLWLAFAVLPALNSALDGSSAEYTGTRRAEEIIGLSEKERCLLLYDRGIGTSSSCLPERQPSFVYESFQASQCADSITTKADQRREQAWHEELERLKAENEHAMREKHPCEQPL
ncbi:hypothetical protein Pmar_PMAR003812 [Perkinsus marinus ATCC 50983]|uniref:Uncharacterized protein n=1 Tax=Perkinsus marinus (strain ATCC 50983 / TXsc) TaxID=423536 RepID=C5KSR9_PERM5|nr:hypothetical protein Pmar_PMAR003812 [Perkinsus marinus ATCC 50983]EER12473.1 hypothetical protein Pmar_PMAR003812 [Perkinsus marinus ATCC 50983]|eukprot:XP_002780678.1 hypothetical protein Pmar_PMAR003812 [Perkinsus marinus ATCC 50983]